MLLRDVLPPQGAWSDEEYLWLTDRCNRLIEFTDGRRASPRNGRGHDPLSTTSRAVSGLPSSPRETPA